MKRNTCDILIVGGGMVGLSIAYQLVKRKISKNIIILEKEREIGLHSSGRNSGVLHAGIYYKPNSLKAKVCISGAKRLASWIEERGLPLYKCGKVIVPQKEDLDYQLDLLLERGKTNGAEVRLIDEKNLRKLIPEAKSSTGRALWSPNTSVVNPIIILQRLEAELRDYGIRFLKGYKRWEPNLKNSEIKLDQHTSISYGHLINCSGLQADKVSRKFGVGEEYSLLPFKGIYWKIKDKCPIKISTNLYPVPDLNVPFLGVHFTPSPGPQIKVNIGPTATPALGRENYNGFDQFEPLMTLRNIGIISNQYFYNQNNFRKYVHEQAFLSFRKFFFMEAQRLIPSLKLEHIEPSDKVGIRAQLFNHKEQRLEDDFLCLQGPKSTHILNAISPAFTASFALADLILHKAKFIIGD